jgi:diacylglycerol kinase family enzyme
MKVHIIANPAAGGGKGIRRAEVLRRALDARGVPVTLTYTERAGDAVGIARDSDAECLVSAGGDGTANEIINGMDLDRCCLAILRAGTANAVSRDLRLKADPGFLAGLIAERSSRRVDLGVLNGRRFLLGVGAGFDAAVVRREAERKSGLRGLRRWVLPTIQVILNFNHAPIRVKVDGEIVTETSTYAIVGNCRYTAGLVPTTPRARLDDGRLDLCALHRISAAKLIWLALSVWSPRFPDSRGVVYRQGAVIELEAASNLPVPVHVDGEAAGFLPARCTALPAALEVIAPA